MYSYIVKLNNIKVEAAHGLYESEKKNNQLFEVDIAISLNRESCNDDIKNSINYEYVYKIILKIFNQNCFSLLETLGEKIIDQIFNDYNVHKVKVTMRKPEVAFDKNTNCIQVTVKRNNE